MMGLKGQGKDKTPPIILAKMHARAQEKVFSIEDMPMNGMHLPEQIAKKLLGSAEPVDHDWSAIDPYASNIKLVFSLTDYSNQEARLNMRYYISVPEFLLLAYRIKTIAADPRLQGGRDLVFTESKGNESSEPVLRRYPGMPYVWRTLQIRQAPLDIGPCFITTMEISRAKRVGKEYKPDGHPVDSLQITLPVGVMAAGFVAAEAFVLGGICEAQRLARAEKEKEEKKEAKRGRDAGYRRYAEYDY